QRRRRILCDPQSKLAGLASFFEVAHNVHNVGKSDWTRLGGDGHEQQQTGDGARVAKDATLHVVRQLLNSAAVFRARHMGFSSKSYTRRTQAAVNTSLA